MPKTGIADDDLFPELHNPKAAPKRGHQEDGTYVTSTGEVLPAKNRERRTPYPEPEDKQAEGNVELCETPDGSLSFESIRMSTPEWRKAGTPERKRLELRYKVTETYAGRPRPYYSYDELEQLRKGEMKR